MDKRIEMANQVMDLFRAQPEVKEVTLRGSLTEGTPDEYSDIDINVDVSGHDNGQYVHRLLKLMYESFDPHFHDFNCSLAPTWYIMNFYPRGVPIFWQIDIVLIAEPHCPSISQADLKAMQDPVAHILKLWVVYLKHLIRGDEGIEEQTIQTMPDRVGGDGWDGLSAWEIMALALDRAEERATKKHREFVAQCHNAYREASRRKR